VGGKEEDTPVPYEEKLSCLGSYAGWGPKDERKNYLSQDALAKKNGEEPGRPGRKKKDELGGGKKKTPSICAGTSPTH